MTDRGNVCGLLRVYSIFALMIGASQWIQAVSGANITVDDADLNMFYSGFWQAGNDCSACWAKPPDHSQIYQATWHDTTAHPTDEARYFQYQFTGTDLYIYSIQVDTVPVVDPTWGIVSKVDLTLTIDGQSQNYLHPINNIGTFEYNIPVFAVHGLSNTAHTMRVTLNPYSMFLFDYLIYTVPEGTSSPATTPSPNALPQATPSSTTPSSNIPSSGTSPSDTRSSGSHSSGSQSSIVSPSTSSPSFSTSTSSSSDNSPLVTSVDTHNSPIAKSASLSSGAIAGIGIGAAIIMGIITALVGFVYGRRRRRWRGFASGNTPIDIITPLPYGEKLPESENLTSSASNTSASPLTPLPDRKAQPEPRQTVPLSPGAISVTLPPYSERGDV